MTLQPLQTLGRQIAWFITNSGDADGKTIHLKSKRATAVTYFEQTRPSIAIIIQLRQSHSKRVPIGANLR